VFDDQYRTSSDQWIVTMEEQYPHAAGAEQHSKTSISAANLHDAGSSQQCVLNYVSECGERGATAHEVCDALCTEGKYSYFLAWRSYGPRLSELVSMGHLYISNRCRISEATGRAQSVYVCSKYETVEDKK
jgi:hypothetical protein